MDTYCCPECSGSGKVKEEAVEVTCYFCEGTGYASEEDSYKENWK